MVKPCAKAQNMDFYYYTIHQRTEGFCQPLSGGSGSE